MKCACDSRRCYIRVFFLTREVLDHQGPLELKETKENKLVPFVLGGNTISLISDAICRCREIVDEMEMMEHKVTLEKRVHKEKLDLLDPVDFQ